MLERYDYFTKWTYIMLLTLVLCSYMVQCRQKNKRVGGGGGGGCGENAYDHNRSAYDYRDHITSSNEEGGVGGSGGSHRRGQRKKNHHNRGYKNDELSIWINEAQLKMLSALFFPQSSAEGRLYAIENGCVHNEVRKVYLYQYLTIPAEVNYVNFTWKAGARRYYYNFDQLQSQDESILKAPTVSIGTKGQIPREEQNFSVFLPCTGNNSGTAMFNIGLSIKRGREQLPGTPLRLSFKKECAHRGVYDSLDASNPTLTSSQGPDPECNLKCGVNGFCNHHKICQCKAGFTGQYCQTPNCFPMCLNGGNCTAPFVCTCPDGYQGTQCEGGICREKCLNGGKCVQKDKCRCSKGYYGNRCEYSKCVIPCKNDGRCIGNNMCRCRNGLGGNHCEIGLKQHKSLCKGRCTHGICQKNKCKCFEGYYGKACNRRNRQRHHNR